MRTGSPMSSTNISPALAMLAASMTSPTASSTVMKKRVTSGWVTVTGSPFSICSDSTDRNEPRLPSTLPKRTEASGCCRGLARLHDHLGQPLGHAEHRGRVGRLVGGDQDEAVDASSPRAASTRLQGAEHVRLHALAGVPFQQRQVLVGGGVEDHLGPEVGEELAGSGPGRGCRR